VGNYHQGALAEILELEPITLVRILDRLQAAGLIERRHHATDRRVRLLYLTPEAHPILGQMRAIGAETRSEALAGVSDADRERLIETLLVMRANLTAPATRIEEAVAHG
jgi:MarR family transcriptional regulator for hemolysin